MYSGDMYNLVFLVESKSAISTDFDVIACYIVKFVPFCQKLGHHFTSNQ